MIKLRDKSKKGLSIFKQCLYDLLEKKDIRYKDGRL